MHTTSFFSLLPALLFGSAYADAPWIRGNYEEYNIDLQWGSFPSQLYKSSPLQSPLWRVGIFERSKLDLSSPFIFTSGPITNDSVTSALIFRADDLSLVYADPMPALAVDARVQKYMGKPYLTYFSGHISGGAHGVGTTQFYDRHYQLKYNVNVTDVSNGGADLHEQQMTSDDTLLMTTYPTKPADLTSIGGPANGTQYDGCFQELDIGTRESLFYWCASDHFNISDSYLPYGALDYGLPSTDGWDWFHINSVHKYGEDYLVNSRLLKLVTLINGTSGEPIWKLGGKSNEFKDLSGGQATNFAYQHHARFHDTDLTKLTLFDNSELTWGLNCEGSNCTRAMHIELDYSKMTAKLAQQLFHPDNLTSGELGSVVNLPNGNTLVWWGQNPGMTEHLPDGTVVMDAQLGPYNGGGISYRAWKQNWTGMPLWAPSIAVENGVAYMSWNGATELYAWRVLTGATHSDLKTETRVPREGFETSVRISARRIAYVQAEALDVHGAILGTTGIVEMSTGTLVTDGSSSYAS
ncbi:Arylsulfotransferase-domain-containing protein [Xylariaceae sp. FL0255]|nr:Arylsulfotransferase-domain-containing protein [Xylariaceae sp. FL0255]